MSSTFVATCRSSNCRIAFDDVIFYCLLQRDDLNNEEYYLQTAIKIGGYIPALGSRLILQLGTTSYIILQVHKTTLLTAVPTIYQFHAFSSNMVHKFGI
jgi:hypothetical protein